MLTGALKEVTGARLHGLSVKPVLRGSGDGRWSRCMGGAAWESLEAEEGMVCVCGVLHDDVLPALDHHLKR
jgi:hypothetical protein